MSTVVTHATAKHNSHVIPVHRPVFQKTGGNQLQPATGLLWTGPKWSGYWLPCSRTLCQNYKQQLRGNSGELRSSTTIGSRGRWHRTCVSHPCWQSNPGILEEWRSKVRSMLVRRWEWERRWRQGGEQEDFSSEWGEWGVVILVDYQTAGTGVSTGVYIWGFRIRGQETRMGKTRRKT